MKNNQTRLKQVDQKHRIRVRQGSVDVLAPLVDDFGFTLGNNYDTPFDMVSLGKMQQKYNLFVSSSQWQQNNGFVQISNKPAFAMDKVYLSPQPAEISFDLKFESYYSAIEEVVEPVLKLYLMSAPKEADIGDTLAGVTSAIAGHSEWFQNFISQVKSSGVQQGVDSATDTIKDNIGADPGAAIANVRGFLSLLTGPRAWNVYFGDVYTIREAYPSSVSVKFSNKVDSIGAPVSAICSITLVLRQVPTIDRIGAWFNGTPMAREIGGYDVGV